MAKGNGIRFIGSAVFLGVLLLIAVGCAIGARVSEGLEQKVTPKENAHTEAVVKAASEVAAPEPRPAEETELQPSKNCTGEVCLYVPGTAGSTIPHPGDDYTVSGCATHLMAHKKGVKADCSLPITSHAIASVCAKNTKAGEWCNMAPEQRDAWIPMPQSIDASGLTAMASQVKAPAGITV
jgi:hypothetical protein